MTDCREYFEIVDHLSAAYDGSAMERDEREKPDWKKLERRRFLSFLLAEDRKDLLEIGSGTGQDAVYFQQHDIRVVATDPSREMVKRCRAKGLDAHIMDSLRLDFPAQTFDAAYAFNSLLHVPNAFFTKALDSICFVLKPRALVYIGQYGGSSFEGILPDDWHDPARFFSFRTDDQLRCLLRDRFDPVDFSTLRGEVNFHAAILRRRPEA